MEEIVAKRIGARVQALRGQRGLDLATLADRAGMSAATLERIEAGQGEPTRDELARLLQLMGCSRDDLIDDD